MAQKPGADPETRELDAREHAVIDAAREKAHILYQGERVAHRSCGIALAETFNLPTRPYQALRRGGITGFGYCGSIRAGEHILGELLGDPDPAGAVTPILRRAMEWYQKQVPARIARGAAPDYICNNLTGQHGDFMGPARKGFCTNLTAEVAALTAETLLRFAPEIQIDIRPIEED
jgi:hypothetical protein